MYLPMLRTRGQGLRRVHKVYICDSPIFLKRRLGGGLVRTYYRINFSFNNAIAFHLSLYSYYKYKKQKKKTKCPNLITFPSYII